MIRWVKSHPKAVAAVLLVLLCGLFGDVQRSRSLLARASYDGYFAWLGCRSESSTECPVVVVYLDLESHLQEHQDPGRPWPRALYARLLRRLKAAGARAVVFDVVFDQAGADPAEDELLRSAIADHGRVVLAGELRPVSGDSGSGAWGRATRVIPPYELLRGAAAGWGVGELAVDPDFVVRQFYPGITDPTSPVPSLTAAAGQVLGLAVPAEKTQVTHWLNYYGPPYQIPHRSLSQVLRPGDLDDAELRDKVVLVGARPLVGLFQDRRDEFRSPYRGWNTRDHFQPGVEVHATQLLNLLRGDGLTRLDSGWERSLLWLAAVCLGAGLLCLRPVPAFFAALSSAGVATFAAVTGFHQAHVWFPWLIVVALQAPVALTGSVLVQSVEWYRARRRLEAAQRLADARIREQAALIEKAQDAILVQDLAGRITYANPSAERLFGWAPGDWPTTEARRFLDTPEAEDARRQATQRGEWQVELRPTLPGGRVLSLESRWTLLREDAGAPKGFLLLISDVTERRQLEAETTRMQRMEAVGALAGGMAHDLNNALAPVLMGTQLLRREVTGENALHILSLMESSTRRGADMVRQVLLFARGRPEEFERLDPGVLAKEVEKLGRDTFPRSLTVTAHVAADVWPVRGNATQLHQVLLNLCVNARDAMPAGGALSVVVDNVALTEEEARAIPDGRVGEFVVLLVSDTGTGIPPDVLARIFEPFFTTKPVGRGTGLGLSTTRRIVKTHGGFLSVHSRLGEGTTFEIYLPRMIEGGAVVPSVATAELARGQAELILVADDDAAVSELLRHCLEDQGYRVLRAANGVEAVSLFKQNAAEVALIISDIAMPLMDGLQAAAAIRQVRPEVPILFLSGEREVVADARWTGPLPQQLPKPVERSALLEAVAVALRRH